MEKEEGEKEEEEQEQEEERECLVARELLLLCSILVIHVDRSGICISCRLLGTCEATTCHRIAHSAKPEKGLG